MEDTELSALAVAYKRGDQQSFSRLVEALTRTLIATAYRYTGDWEWARDITQDTWVKVHYRIQRYDPDKSFRAWIFSIQRNGCLDHLRRGWVRREETLGDEALIARSTTRRAPTIPSARSNVASSTRVCCLGCGS